MWTANIISTWAERMRGEIKARLRRVTLYLETNDADRKIKLRGRPSQTYYLDWRPSRLRIAQEQCPKEHIKTPLSDCGTDEERKTILLMFARNPDHSAEVIKGSTSEMGITVFNRAKACVTSRVLNEDWRRGS